MSGGHLYAEMKRFGDQPNRSEAQTYGADDTPLTSQANTNHGGEDDRLAANAINDQSIINQTQTSGANDTPPTSQANTNNHGGEDDRLASNAISDQSINQTQTSGANDTPPTPPGNINHRGEDTDCIFYSGYVWKAESNWIRDDRCVCSRLMCICCVYSGYCACCCTNDTDNIDTDNNNNDDTDNNNNDTDVSCQCCKGCGSRTLLAIKWTVLLFVLCPILWFALSTALNIAEAVVWGFEFPGVLWFVYFVATLPPLVDFGVNCSILVKLKSWIDLTRLAPAMLMDFIFITCSLAACLMPIMLKGSTDPDDNLNTKFYQMSTNMLDDFAILALTASNMVMNKLLGTVIHHAICQRKIYHEDDIFGKVVTTPNRALAKREFSAAAYRAAERVQGHVSTQPTPLNPSAEWTLALIEKFIFEMNSATDTGRARSIMKLKMFLNVASVNLFAFYENLYIKEGMGGFVFVMFLSVLSFMNNLTSAAAIKQHDNAVNRMFGEEMKLSVGDSHGINHVQYYYSVILSLVNVVIRASAAA
jgi:hypothetical protein